MVVMTRPHRPHIGWREWVALPELGVPAIKAKVDTGARTSSLHAWDAEVFDEQDRRRVRFVLHPVQRDMRRTVECVADLVEMREVRNSGGGSEPRPVIVTVLQLGDAGWPIEITLSRRDEMGFRMLLGRQAIRGHFVVDPGRSFLTGRPGVERRS
jgi:hypothetical protein